MSQSSIISPTTDMIERAAHWAALLDSGDVRDEDRAACEMWCAQHPLHRRTLDRMRAFDAQVERAGELEQDALRKLLAKQSSRRRLGGSLLGVAGLLIAAWLWTQSSVVRDEFVDYRTSRGELRTVALDDGSQLTLDTEGAVGISLSGELRRVRLIRGQILARVSKDQRRPFVVETPHGTATALGTAFIVRRQEQDTIVTVTESRVRVCPVNTRQEDDGCRVLGPGERARVAPSAITLLPSIDPDAAIMWASGWLEVDDQEVSEVLAELNRYRDRPVWFDADALRGLKVTGSFPLTDVDRAIEGIARTAPLEVQRSGDAEVSVVRRR